MAAIPEEYADVEAPKLFNKWTFEAVEVKDIALQDYVQVKQALYLPHTAGRYQAKRFRKAQVRPHLYR
jgi:small subunit ribosomal protein S5e